MHLRNVLCLSMLATSIACSSTSEPVRGTEPAPDAGETDAAPAEQVDAAPDAGPTLTPQAVVVPQLPTSCDAFCKTKGTTCTPSCPATDGPYAGSVTSRVDLSTPKYETHYAKTCAEVLRPAAQSVGDTTAYCCCMAPPRQTVEKKLTGSTSCDDVCSAQGLTCEGRGSADFMRADGTTCSTTLACDEPTSPTSSCAQKPSVSAKLTCYCR